AQRVCDRHRCGARALWAARGAPGRSGHPACCHIVGRSASLHAIAHDRNRSRRRRMRFYEFEAKALLGKAGVPVAKGGTATTPDEAAKIVAQVGGEVVLKSQVLSGGRMKAGGVKFASSPDEARAHAESILKLEISGQMPRCVLIDAKQPV